MLLRDRSAQILPGLVVCTSGGLQRTGCGNALIQDKYPHLASVWLHSHRGFVRFSLPLRLMKPVVTDEAARTESLLLFVWVLLPWIWNTSEILFCIFTFWSVSFKSFFVLRFEAQSEHDRKSMRERDIISLSAKYYGYIWSSTKEKSCWSIVSLPASNGMLML